MTYDREARELLAVEYERDELTNLAAEIRKGAGMGNSIARALRAISRALSQSPPSSQETDK